MSWDLRLVWTVAARWHACDAATAPASLTVVYIGIRRILVSPPIVIDLRVTAADRFSFESGRFFGRATGKFRWVGNGILITRCFFSSSYLKSYWHLADESTHSSIVAGHTYPSPKVIWSISVVLMRYKFFFEKADLNSGQHYTVYTFESLRTILDRSLPNMPIAFRYRSPKHSHTSRKS